MQQDESASYSAEVSGLCDQPFPAERLFFPQYCQGEENVRETIGLLNRIGFSPISSPFSEG